MTPRKRSGDRHTKQQIHVRLTDDALTILAALQAAYGTQAGLPEPLAQSQALEIGLRELARSHNVTVPNTEEL